jgi:hypothetical protein
VIAAAVAALVVLAGKLGHSRQWRNPSEDPFAVVRVQPRLIPLGHGQRTSFVPDRAGDTYSSQIVQVSRNAYGLYLIAQPQRPGGLGCKITHCCGMAKQPRTFQVDQVAERSGHVGQLLRLDPAYGLRLGIEHRLVRVNLVKIAKQLIGSFDQ